MPRDEPVTIATLPVRSNRDMASSNGDTYFFAKRYVSPFLEHDHGPCGFAGSELVDRRIDLGEADPLGDQSVEVEAAGEVEIDEAGDVEREAVGAHQAALKLLLGEEGHRRPRQALGQRHP